MKKILKTIFLNPPLYALALVMGYLAMSTATTNKATCEPGTCKEATNYACIKKEGTFHGYCDPTDYCPS